MPIGGYNHGPTPDFASGGGAGRTRGRGYPGRSGGRTRGGGLSMPGEQSENWFDSDLPNPGDFTIQMPDAASPEAMRRGVRAQNFSRAMGASAANNAIAGGAYGNSRAALAGGNNMLRSGIQEGVQANDQILERDIDRQLGVRRFNSEQELAANQFVQDVLGARAAADEERRRAYADDRYRYDTIGEQNALQQQQMYLQLLQMLMQDREYNVGEMGNILNVEDYDRSMDVSGFGQRARYM